MENNGSSVPVPVSPLNISLQEDRIIVAGEPVNITVCPTSLRDNTDYVRYYILVANFVVMVLIPFIILSVLNTMLYKAVKQTGSMYKKTTSRQRRDQSIAVILAAIVVVFAFCNVFRMIINLYEVFHLVMFGDMNNRWPSW